MASVCGGRAQRGAQRTAQGSLWWLAGWRLWRGETAGSSFVDNDVLLKIAVDPGCVGGFWFISWVAVLAMGDGVVG